MFVSWWVLERESCRERERERERERDQWLEEEEVMVVVEENLLSQRHTHQRISYPTLLTALQAHRHGVSNSISFSFTKKFVFFFFFFASEYWLYGLDSEVFFIFGKYKVVLNYSWLVGLIDIVSHSDSSESIWYIFKVGF